MHFRDLGNDADGSLTPYLPATAGRLTFLRDGARLPLREEGA